MKDRNGTQLELGDWALISGFASKSFRKLFGADGSIGRITSFGINPRSNCPLCDRPEFARLSIGEHDRIPASGCFLTKIAGENETIETVSELEQVA